MEMESSHIWDEDIVYSCRKLQVIGVMTYKTIRLPVTSESAAALDELPMFLMRLIKTVDKMDKNEETLTKVTSTIKNKLGEIKSAEDKKIVTKYAVFHVLADIKKFCTENPDEHVLLFLDEFNDR